MTQSGMKMSSNQDCTDNAVIDYSLQKEQVYQTRNSYFTSSTFTNIPKTTDAGLVFIPFVHLRLNADTEPLMKINLEIKN
jgi:hypothetical protein